MTVAVVHRVAVEDGRNPPESPFCAQDVDWGEINKQRAAAREFARLRARDMAYGPELPVPLPPLWP